jgi:hypothetical protein
MLGGFAVDSAVICASMTGWIYTRHVLVGRRIEGFLSCATAKALKAGREKRCDRRNLEQTFGIQAIGYLEGYVPYKVFVVHHDPVQSLRS